MGKIIIKVFMVFIVLFTALFPNANAEICYEDMANIISGISPDKYYKKIEKEKFWPEYQKIIEKEWHSVFHYKIEPIRKWTDSNLPDLNKTFNTLFYPFAGADFLFANSFFPNMKNYILIGLEPLGTFLDLEALPSESNENYLKKISKAVYTPRRFGFFQTHRMAEDLNQEDLNGTVHLFAFYIKRCGYHLSNVKYFSLDTLGKIRESLPEKDPEPYGVQFDFYGSSESQKQTLYYFSYDLSDDNLIKNNEILLFAQSFGRLTTYLKAASYLMHIARFDRIRNFILDTSDEILEDDSGIPYRQFHPNKWKINLYGTYSRTIRLFKNKYQPELKKAYESSPFKGDLPFWIGYNISHKEVNLLYAKRKLKHPQK